MQKFAEEKNISEIADAIFESYRLVGRINNTDGSLLPSKGVIGAICESFLELPFPGVYGDEPIYSPHLRNVTAHRLRGIAQHHRRWKALAASRFRHRCRTGCLRTSSDDRQKCRYDCRYPARRDVGCDLNILGILVRRRGGIRI